MKIKLTLIVICSNLLLCCSDMNTFVEHAESCWKIIPNTVTELRINKTTTIPLSTLGLAAVLMHHKQRYYADFKCDQGEHKLTWVDLARIKNGFIFDSYMSFESNLWSLVQDYVYSDEARVINVSSIIMLSEHATNLENAREVLRILFHNHDKYTFYFSRHRDSQKNTFDLTVNFKYPYKLPPQEREMHENALRQIIKQVMNNLFAKSTEEPRDLTKLFASLICLEASKATHLSEVHSDIKRVFDVILPGSYVQDREESIELFQSAREYLGIKIINNPVVTPTLPDITKFLVNQIDTRVTDKTTAGFWNQIKEYWSKSNESITLVTDIGKFRVKSIHLLYAFILKEDYLEGLVELIGNDASYAPTAEMTCTEYMQRIADECGGLTTLLDILIDQYKAAPNMQKACFKAFVEYIKSSKLIEAIQDLKNKNSYTLRIDLPNKCKIGTDQTNTLSRHISQFSQIALSKMFEKDMASLAVKFMHSAFALYADRFSMLSHDYFLGKLIYLFKVSDSDAKALQGEVTAKQKLYLKDTEFGKALSRCERIIIHSALRQRQDDDNERL